MCTAISMRSHNFYFGRNLDVDFSFGEKVVVTPRNFTFNLVNLSDYKCKYALIGMATVIDKIPLYYDCMNECGLCIAGLNFPLNAHYNEPEKDKCNIALFEFIPFVLGQCKDAKDALKLIENINLTNTAFNGKIPSTPLHFMISDENGSFVIEPMSDGIKIYENKFNVLTNNPPFPYHKWNMNNYLNLSNKNGENKFTDKFELQNYGVGMGALGLPGDASSPSRFVRASFNLANAQLEKSETDCVSQFFHILDTVKMVRGATLTDNGKNDYTLYSSCINATEKIYYYKTYENSQINAVSLNGLDLNSNSIFEFELQNKQNINYQN